jgi:hypothetical protein
MITERTINRRINGQSIPCYETRDGVQRREWVGVDSNADAAFGYIQKHRSDERVTARRPDGLSRVFVGNSADQAFATARAWLVA